MASVLVSCSKFIDINPESQAITNQAYKTDADFKGAIIGIYNGLQDPYEDFWQFGDLRGDDVKQAALRNTGMVRVDNFVMDPSDGLVEGNWRDFYNIIYRINVLLSEIKTKDESVVPNKAQYISEAKFIRALIYFDLVRIWGAVPKVTTPLTIEEASETGRTEPDSIYDEIIIPDLQDAESNLPAKYDGSDVGRATKGAATALLGKVYLTTHNFVKAETELQKVTTMGYALLDNFNDLFDYTNEHGSEYIFDIEYIDGGLGLGSNFAYFGVESQDVGGDLIKALSIKYNLSGPEAGGSGTPSDALFSIFDSTRDKRMSITAARGIYDQNGNWVPVNGRSLVTAFTQKYYTARIDPNDTKANWRVIRYAGVLLMYAEALNENGKGNLALTYLNKVRTRAGLDEYSGLNQEEIRKEIYLERRRELYMEGNRWFDLVRTGRALEVMEPYGMKPYNMLFPIPQDQIDVVNNSSVFAQNPGY